KKKSISEQKKTCTARAGFRWQISVRGVAGGRLFAQGFGQHGRYIAELGAQRLDLGGAQAHGGVLVVRRVARIAQAIAGAADGEALLVEQRTDAADQQDFMMLVVAAVAAPLHRL